MKKRVRVRKIEREGDREIERKIYVGIKRERERKKERERFFFCKIKRYFNAITPI